MVEVPLTQGAVALIDDEDAARVMAYKWTLKPCRRRKRFYARRSIWLGAGKSKAVLLHRFILNAPDHLQVDHINGDGLDNRRCNLRLATNAENHWNVRGERKNATGFRGVGVNFPSGRFHARIKVNSQQIELGSYDTAEEAARVYDAAAKQYHGEFATLNFPEAERQREREQASAERENAPMVKPQPKGGLRLNGIEV